MPKKDSLKPIVLESIGEAPPQHPPCDEEGRILNDLTVKTITKFTAQIEQFLRACKDEGDIIIDDVLERLKHLEKET